MTPDNWGATPTEWAHFDLILGCTSDLLPVVSNPAAQISEGSNLKALGKVPSTYGATRKVRGFPQWTKYTASGVDIDKWSKEPDYGICLQTRRVRAIDLDLTDEAFALEVWGVLEGLTFKGLHSRYRSNSPKSLFLFEVEGPLEKQVIKTAHGIIEFLGDGQQCIVAGTHPSKVRYEWSDGLPTEIPVLPRDHYLAVIAELQKRYGVAPASKSKPAAAPSADPIAAHLETAGWVLGTERDGRLHIRCPWEDEHTTDTGPSATSYFPAHTGGYARGHFKCLHAHCSDKTDQDFQNAVGYTALDFAPVVAEPADAPVHFTTNKNGQYLATIENLTKALRSVPIAGWRIGHDLFRDEIMLGYVNGTEHWRAFKDTDYTKLRIRLERGGFLPIGREIIRDVVANVADEHQFDSAMVWLNELRWDGVPRIEQFFTHYFGVANSEYARAVSRYLWTAMAGRVLSPGCKADMTPVLIGAQGIGKSTAVSAMVPSLDHFVEVSLNTHDDDQARKMRGKLVGEIAELRGLGTRDLESIKAFCSRTHEQWVPKYREFSTSFPRRLVFIATTNQDEFLADETGNRRWLPLLCRYAHTAAIATDRLLLWAEARELFNVLGVDHLGAAKEAPVIHAEHMISDSWESIIQRWFDTSKDNENVIGGGYTGEPFSVHDVLVGALNLTAVQMNKGVEMRVCKILRGLGGNKRTVRVGKKLQKLWVMGESVTTSGVNVTTSG